MRPATRAPVVVGIDGSDPSARALEVAAAAAAYRDTPLLIVHTYHVPALVQAAPIGMVAPSPLIGTGPSDWNRKLLADARARVRRRFPSLDVDTVLLEEAPARALINESRGAELVVVGCQGMGGFTGLLLGSVSAQVATHARSPVLVVRGPAGKPIDAPVILGIDVWELPADAIAFAFEEAVHRDAPLHAVYAGHAAPGTVADMLAPWHGKYPDVRLTTETIDETDAGRALVGFSASAAMVVVGSHERGQLRSQLLGSVGYTLIHRAHSTVAIVHARKEGGS